MIGARLGAYEIRAKVGAGGMGDVYRATDTSLGREVAIKLLSAEVAADPERLGRFEREARLLASLNHPSVAHVYGFEKGVLPDGSAAHLLAMEIALRFANRETQPLAVSPDGRLVACAEAAGGIAIVPIEGGDVIRIPGMGTNDLPIQWTADGRRLFVF
jgi:hypothetical protein